MYATPEQLGIPAELLDRARALHNSTVVLDTHVDTTQYLLEDGWDFAAHHDVGHVDWPRLREGGVSGIFFAVYAGKQPNNQAAIAAARQQLDAIHRLVDRHKPDIVLARTSADVRSAKERNRLAMLIGIEGGHLIGESLDVLREYHQKGAVYMTLTHSFNHSWADSAGVHTDVPAEHNGLTAFGRDVIGQMNRLGMMVDITHVSDKTFWDTLEVSSAPILATHSNCRAVCNHRRNLTDDMLRTLAERGGVLQINAASYFLDPKHPPPDLSLVNQFTLIERQQRGEPSGYISPLSIMVDHFEHAIQLVGPAHVGIGTDYDGVPYVPAGVEDCSRLPMLTAALMARGYSDEDLRLMLGENVLRVMDACRRIASEPDTGNREV